MPSGFWEEDFWNVRESEPIIGHDNHIKFSISTKNSNFIKYPLMNIHDKFGSNGPSGFGE
jgi:hypothetical protein